MQRQGEPPRFTLIVDIGLCRLAWYLLRRFRFGSRFRIKIYSVRNGYSEIERRAAEVGFSDQTVMQKVTYTVSRPFEWGN